MNTRNSLYILLIFLVFLYIMIHPFLPGKYDPLAIPLATMVQLYSGLGLLTTIPAVLWLLRNIKYPTETVPRDSSLLKHRIYLKLYFWSTFAVLFTISLFTLFGISTLLGIFSFSALIYLTRILWKRITRSKSALFSLRLPSFLALLPVLLFVIQLTADMPLTSWSRKRAIQNSSELINEIENYKVRKGTYPLTLNAKNKDYSTGITGIERYHYTYDNSTFNIFFEQPRFFFDRFGTQEFVVYNPHERHLMMSHVAWHMLLEPNQMRNGQGWYESVETGIPHWKSFMFD